MARRYDSRTTTFSPEGRLYQVEYAMEAINLAGSTVGVLAEDGVVLAGEKKTTSKLLDQAKQHEKLFQIDDAMFCATAGIPSDANILINKLRLTAQQHVYSYSESMPVEQLVTSICDLKQGYTQFGGLRPFGVSFLVAGYDESHGFQLYHTDPSGNFSGWKAYAIGMNNNTAQQIMRQDWKQGLKVQEALELVAKVLVKTMDTATPNAEKLEFGVVERTQAGNVRFRMLKDTEINKLMADATPKEGEEAAPAAAAAAGSGS
jgi:20S proteasome subunit alpha 3